MRQRGSLTVEFAIMVPAMVLLFGVVIGGARTWLARSNVEHVAGAAARAVSLERSAGEAPAVARTLATRQASASGMRCEPLSVDVDASALSQPAGTAGRIVAVVHCRTPLADIVVPGWPGSVDIAASAEAVVDTYRERRP